MTLPISVQVLTLNSARHLRACLESVRGFDEVILCDNGSTDDTLEIARSFANVRVMHSPFIGFGPLRRLATAQAGHDWILALDSDEQLSAEACQEIVALHASLNPQTLYALPRRNRYRGQVIRCCGWHPDYVSRLFHRRVTTYSAALVHESVILQPGMRVVKLRQVIHHDSFDGVSGLIDKMQRYSDLYARQYAGKRHASVPMVVLKTFVAFIKNYIIQGGILDGANGFLISVSNATGVFFKYMKLRELNSQLSLRSTREE
ncbi:MAG: glycosyltransferase family 2 protein [Magnetococcales bacterium]|nr:glycosyltransferase family 2 protein [Magnetococcales bacterium]